MLQEQQKRKQGLYTNGHRQRGLQKEISGLALCIQTKGARIIQMRSSWNEGEPSGYRTQQDRNHVSTPNSQTIYIIPQKAPDYTIFLRDHLALFNIILFLINVWSCIPHPKRI